MSRANAYARINRLIDDGVIRGFSARVNHERAGQGASAYITLKIVQNSWRTVREQLQALPGAAHIALVSGDFDVLLLVHTPDNRTLRELVLTRLQSIPRCSAPAPCWSSRRRTSTRTRPAERDRVRPECAASARAACASEDAGVRLGRRRRVPGRGHVVSVPPVSGGWPCAGRRRRAVTTASATCSRS